MNIVGIIPGRMASSRFPGKPLARIAGIPMIGHCYLRSRMSSLLQDVFIATCDQEIVEYGNQIGAPSIMTRNTHERATERVAEAVDKIEAQTQKAVDIVVMIQGDEPMIHPAMIDESVGPLINDPAILIANLMAPISSREEHDDPNEVKVVVDRNSFALYFSREPIPSWKKGAKEVPMLKQVCVIPFRRNFLKTFIALPPTPLEEIESVDMLRAMEHGFKVKMVMTQYESYSVDTPEDLQYVEPFLRKDPLVAQYRPR